MRKDTRTLWVVALLIAGMAASGSCEVLINTHGVRRVATGQIAEARASWWGFDPVDATNCLQAAIDSGVPELIVDNIGEPWIVNPIRLRSNQDIYFEAGVQVVAKKGSFRGGGDSLFTAWACENLSLRGDPVAPAVLRMHRTDYDNPPYKKAEWRMVLNLRGCRDMLISDLVLRESGGDGIYLGAGKDSLPNKNVTIKRVVCDRNYRQGISVICAEDLLIEDCTLISTGGTPPMAGIDFEPNRITERLVRCVMRNCITQGNSGCGYAIYIPTLDASSRPVSLRFENCRSLRDGSYGVFLATGNTPDKAVKGTIEFVDCSFDRSGNAGIMVANNPPTGCRIRFDDCSIRGVSRRRGAASPIVLMARRGATRDVGGLEFNNCLVWDYLDRKPMSFADVSGFIRPVEISGTLAVYLKGVMTQHALTPDVLNKWMPVSPIKRVPPVALDGLNLRPVSATAEGADYGMPGVRLRGSASYVLHAAAGQQVSVRVGFGRVGRYEGTEMAVKVTSPSGKECAKTSVPFLQEVDVAFTASETGLYRIGLTPGRNWGRIVNSSHPVNLSTDGGAAGFYGSPGELFFWVPAGTREFALHVFGEGVGEGVKATVIDPDGKVLQEKDNIGKLHQFLIHPPKGAAGASYSIRLTKPSLMALEDNHLQVMGIPPLVAAGKDALLRPVGR